MEFMNYYRGSNEWINYKAKWFVGYIEMNLWCCVLVLPSNEVLAVLLVVMKLSSARFK